MVWRLLGGAVIGLRWAGEGGGAPAAPVAPAVRRDTTVLLLVPASSTVGAAANYLHVRVAICAEEHAASGVVCGLRFAVCGLLRGVGWCWSLGAALHAACYLFINVLIGFFASGAVGCCWLLVVVLTNIISYMRAAARPVSPGARPLCIQCPQQASQRCPVWPAAASSL